MEMNKGEGEEAINGLYDLFAPEEFELPTYRFVVATKIFVRLWLHELVGYDSYVYL